MLIDGRSSPWSEMHWYARAPTLSTDARVIEPWMRGSTIARVRSASRKCGRACKERTRARFSVFAPCISQSVCMFLARIFKAGT